MDHFGRRPAVFPAQCNHAAIHLVLEQAQGIIQHRMHVDRRHFGLFGRSQVQHLRDQAVDALQFTPHHFSHFGILFFFHQYLAESVDGHQSVFDFVGDARGEKAEIGQAVELLEIVLHRTTRSRSNFPGWAGMFMWAPDDIVRFDSLSSLVGLFFLKVRETLPPFWAGHKQKTFRADNFLGNVRRGDIISQRD